MRTIIRYLAGTCHTLLTLPILALLLKGYAALQAHDWSQGGVWLLAGLTCVYVWHFGGNWAVNLVHRKTETA